MKNLSVEGMFRVYWNRHGAAPLVWCVAVATPPSVDWRPISCEVAIVEVNIGVPCKTVYSPKATPDDEDGRPSGWIEAAGVLEVDAFGVATIREPGEVP